MEAIEEVQRNGMTARIFPDTDPMSPAEWDTFGTLYMPYTERTIPQGFLPVCTDYHALPVFIRYDRMRGAVVVPFRFEDYGSSGARIYPCDADDDANGYAVASREDYEKEAAPARANGREWTREDAENALRTEVNTWGQYFQGDVYGITITEDATGETIESVWGFYGLDYAKEEAARMLADADDLEARTKAALLFAETLEHDARERAEKIRADMWALTGPIPF